MSKKLMEVREEFSRMLNDPTHLNAPSRDIAAAFLQSHRSKFDQDVWDEVTKTGLVHIMGDLRKRRRPPSGDSIDTPDLFASYDLEPIVVVRVVEDGVGPVEKNKDLGSVTLPEALDYIARHSKERAANTKRIREWRRLISRVKPYMTRDGMTLSEGLQSASAAEAKRKKDSEKK